MRDFNRRKLNLRRILATELLQRGVPPEEVARLCRPTATEIHNLDKEIHREMQADQIDAIDAEFWDVIHDEVEEPNPLLFEPVVMFMLFVLLLAFTLGVFLGGH